MTAQDSKRTTGVQLTGTWERSTARPLMMLAVLVAVAALAPLHPLLNLLLWLEAALVELVKALL